MFSADKHTFVMWGKQHAAVLLVALVSGWALIRHARRKLSPAMQYQLGNALGFAGSASVVLDAGIRMAGGGFRASEHLPLALCNLMALLLPILMISRRQLVYEIYYFWTLAGTFQAVVTPHLYHGFPHYEFFKYSNTGSSISGWSSPSCMRPASTGCGLA